MLRKSISIAVITALLVSNAEAALLTNVQGTVTVNRGEGFAPAGNTAVLAPGDRVRAETGSADIVYDNGCTVKLGAGQTVAVLYAAPDCGGGLWDGAASSSGISTGTLLVGGLVVAGGIGAGIALSQKSSKPASP
ncbi:MAG: hypothetical protein ACLP7P_18085 [Rhodomicrobium sp.]